MSESMATPSIGADEVAALKLVALDGATAGSVKVSCAGLGDRLDASSQTASRRLQRLESAGLLDREVVSDGQWVSLTDDGEARLRAEYADYRRIFEEAADLELRGSVTGGMGEGRHYISLPGYMTQFREKLEYEPFAGTLNVDLDEESVRSRVELESLVGVPIEGWEDEERTYGPATCYPATVSAAPGGGERWTDEEDADADRPGDVVPEYEPVHIIVPERTHHDEDQIELIAPEKLRDELGLADGDEVTVRVEEAEWPGES